MKRSGPEAAPPTAAMKRSAPEAAPPTAVARTDGYFESYATLGIHQEMLRCHRTDAYLEAIAALDLQGKVVLDVGCGTGVLAIACARAGARAVYAVEASPVADAARRVVEANGHGGVITVIHGRMEEVELPEKVDLIVSEWMGCLALYESMLDAVLIARDRWLVPGGQLVPRRARIWLAPYRDQDTWDERVCFWDRDVHGIDMSCLAATAAAELGRRPAIEWAAPHHVVADGACVIDLDLAAMPAEEALAASGRFAFRCDCSCDLHAFVGWFDVELTPGKWLGTAPADEPTHWRQTLLYLGAPLPVQQDTRIEGQMAMKQNGNNPRCWDLTLSGRAEDPATGGSPAASARVFARSYALDVDC